MMELVDVVDSKSNSSQPAVRLENPCFSYVFSHPIFSKFPMDLLKKPDLEARISCVFSRLILFDEPDLFSPMGRKSPQTLGKSSV
ncbi:MAG: hypothetical protein II028_05820, partial [Clostridia bacterium]|nr:hypothetical protein [Clostridia bacterium]